jgi:hypothetical protein
VTLPFKFMCMCIAGAIMGPSGADLEPTGTVLWLLRLQGPAGASLGPDGVALMPVGTSLWHLGPPYSVGLRPARSTLGQSRLALGPSGVTLCY